MHRAKDAPTSARDVAALQTSIALQLQYPQNKISTERNKRLEIRILVKTSNIWNCFFLEELEATHFVIRT